MNTLQEWDTVIRRSSCQTDDIRKQRRFFARETGKEMRPLLTEEQWKAVLNALECDSREFWASIGIEE